MTDSLFTFLVDDARDGALVICVVVSMQPDPGQTLILAQQAGFKTVCGLNADYMADYYRLRANVFRSELRWIGDPDDEMDIESYDSNAVHFFTLSPANKLIAALRILPTDQKWMMEECFNSLIPRDVDLHTMDACEISRLAIAKSWRNYYINNEFTVAEFLYKGVFQYCLAREIRLCNMVTTRALVCHLRKKGMPVKILAKHRMTDGLLAIMAQLDWYAFINKNSRRFPHRLAWYLDVYDTSQQRLAS